MSERPDKDDRRDRPAPPSGDDGARGRAPGRAGDGAREERVRPEHLRAVRLGHGANCSSVGSVIDTLFVSAAIGGAIFAAICAAMRDERVTVVGNAVRGADASDAQDERAQDEDAQDERAQDERDGAREDEP